jgi:hypothetical protein
MPEEQYETMGTNGRRGAEDFDFNVLTQKLVDVIETVS